MKKIAGLFLLLMISVVSVMVGTQTFSLHDLFTLSETEKLILFSTRIPRTISLVTAGSVMSVCGLLMQLLTQNRFVSPTTAGTVDGARLGILVALVFFNEASLIQQTFIAFLFAAIGTLLFIGILNRFRFRNVILVPLVGLMLGNILGSLAVFLAYQNELVQNVSSWLQANFSLVSVGNYELIYLSVPLLGLVYLLAHYFTVVGLGREAATELGIRYQFLQTSGLVIVSLATAAVTLTVGTIPFLGVIVPNIVSKKKGDHLRNSLFETALIGAIFLVICDVLGRLVLFPYEIPVSLIVGSIGSILFVYLLIKGESV